MCPDYGAKHALLSDSVASYWEDGAPAAPLCVSMHTEPLCAYLAMLSSVVLFPRCFRPTTSRDVGERESAAPDVGAVEAVGVAHKLTGHDADVLAYLVGEELPVGPSFPAQAEERRFISGSDELHGELFLPLLRELGQQGLDEPGSLLPGVRGVNPRG